MQPQDQKSNAQTSDNNNKPQPDATALLPALVAPDPQHPVEKVCLQCERTAHDLSRCPLTGLWFCNDHCRVTCRDTQPRLFQQMIRNNATKQQQPQPAQQPELAVRKSARNLPKPIEINADAEEDTDEFDEPVKRTIEAKKKTTTVATKKKNDAAKQKAKSKKTTKGRSEERGEKSKKRDRDQRREEREMEDGEAAPIRLVDTLGPRQYRLTEDLKRALRVNRLFWQRNRAESDAETNRRRMQKIRTDRDTVLDAYQKQIDALNAYMDTLERAMEELEEKTKLTRLGEDRTDLMLDWLRDDRERVEKLRDVYDDIGDRYSDEALGYVAPAQPVVDAIVHNGDALMDVMAENNNNNQEEQHHSIDDEYPDTPPIDDDNDMVVERKAVVSASPVLGQSPTQSQNNNNTTNNNNASPTRNAPLVSPFEAIQPMLANPSATTADQPKTMQPAMATMPTFKLKPDEPTTPKQPVEKQKKKMAGSDDDERDGEEDEGENDGGSDYSAESSSSSEEIVRSQRAKSRVRTPQRAAPPKVARQPVTQQQPRRKSLLIADILNGQGGPQARGKKQLKPLAFVAQPQASSPTKDSAPRRALVPLNGPLVNRAAPPQSEQETKAPPRKRRAILTQINDK